MRVCARTYKNIYLSVCLSVCLSISLSVCLSVYNIHTYFLSFASKDLDDGNGTKAGFLNLEKKYGKTFGIFFGSMPHVITSDPQVLKQVFIKDFHYFANRQLGEFVWSIIISIDRSINLSPFFYQMSTLILRNHASSIPYRSHPDRCSL